MGMAVLPLSMAFGGVEYAASLKCLLTLSICLAFSVQ